jgi:putative ABC transport system substrate-binding protein
MRRREFITLLGGAAVGWPFAASAQQPAMPVVGFVHTQSLDAAVSDRVREFRQGLKDGGYVDGENVTIEFRWAEGQFDRLPALMAELVRRQVSVIAATGGTESVSAAKKATSTIPIVFTTGADPVVLGLVASLNRPGANVTGVTPFTRQLGPKQLGLLQAIVPKASVIAVLVNRSQLDSEAQLRDIQDASRTAGLQILPLRISSERDLEKAFKTLISGRAGGLLVGGGAFFTAHRVQLVVLAARHAIPAIYSSRDLPVAGGLMSYASRITDAYHQVGVYVGRILNGERPGDLPVIQPTKFELVINLKTAKTLGLTVPLTLLATADEVIE